MKRTTIVEATAILFIILFLYTGISKLLEFPVFREQIEDSPLMAPIAPLVIWGLPVIEFTVSIVLFIPRWRLKGLYSSLILMILFTCYVIFILLFFKHLPCSCGGIIGALSWKAHLILNLGLILLAVLGIRLGRNIPQTGDGRFATLSAGY